MANFDNANQNVDTAQHESLGAGVDQYFKNLLEASSLGTPAARQIREETDQGVIEDVRRRLMTSHADNERQGRRVMVSYCRVDHAVPARRVPAPRRLPPHGPSSTLLVAAGGGTADHVPAVDFGTRTSTIITAADRNWFPQEPQERSAYYLTDVSGSLTAPGWESGLYATLDEAVREPMTVVLLGTTHAGKSAFLAEIVRNQQLLEPNPCIGLWRQVARISSPEKYYGEFTDSFYVQNPGTAAVPEDPPAGYVRQVFQRWLNQYKEAAFNQPSGTGFDTRSSRAIYLAHSAGRIPVSEPPSLLADAVSRLVRSRILEGDVHRLISAEEVSAAIGLTEARPRAWAAPYGAVSLWDLYSGSLSLRKTEDARPWTRRNHIPHAGMLRKQVRPTQPWHWENSGSADTERSAQALAELLLHLDPGQLLALCTLSYRHRQDHLYVSLSRQRQSRHWESTLLQEPGLFRSAVVPVGIRDWLPHVESHYEDSGISAVPDAPDPDSPGEMATGASAGFSFTARVKAKAAAFGTHFSPGARELR